MKDKVQEEILRYQMIRQGDRVVAALSGGADSMALLAFLRELAGPMGFGLEACHVNHGLRGEESDRDEAFVFSTSVVPSFLSQGVKPKRRTHHQEKKMCIRDRRFCVR